MNEEQDSQKLIIGVYLDDQELERLKIFLSSIDCYLFDVLPEKLRILYDFAQRLKELEYISHGWTQDGYVSFLNECSQAKETTGIPFSLTEDYGGLCCEAYGDAEATAIEKGKELYGQWERQA